MIADALLCLLAPSAARWTVVTVDRRTGQDLPMPTVRFRWRSSAQAWARRHAAQWDRRGVAVNLQPRPLRPGWRYRLD